jgi:hypothetical protein
MSDWALAIVDHCGYESPDMARNPFTDHPREVGESYGQHFGVASRVGIKMIAGGLACFVHAVFPFLCVNRGSETIKDLHKGLSKRVDKPNWERHPII